ncbi:MAG: helix-turn-helix domain-containing protein [Eubacteriales bacterium]|nr:helix-turn-helix domain-containing protein [Eubacteriales bacterium]
MLNKDDMLSLSQAADLVGVSRQTMRKIANASDFPIVRISPRRLVIYRPKLEEWIRRKSDQSVGGYNGAPED